MENNLSLNMTRIPNELKLILEIIKHEDSKSLQTVILEEYHDVNWKQLLELAVHHRLYPLLYGKLKQLSNDLIPQDLLQSLNGLYRRNTFHMLHLSREMEQICKVFNENHINSIVLKGPVLAIDLYGDLSLRTSADLDILIPIAELDKVDQILTGLGFKKDDYIETVLNDWTWRHHHFTYVHPQKGVKCEIHWRLHPGPGKEPSFNELWSRKRISSLTSYPIYYLGREDLFLFLVAHGARHGWSRLRWLTDIDKLLKQELNWIFLRQLLTKYHYLHIGGQAIILSSQFLKTNITKEMKSLKLSGRPNKLAQEAVFYCEKMINLHTDPVPDDVSRYHKRHLISLMSNHQKILFVLSLLHPYPTDAKTLPLPKYLHFLYYPLRPFLWIWRKTRKFAVQ